MAKTAEAYCDAIDRFLLPREHPQNISYEAMNAALGADRFRFYDTKPLGNPAHPDHTTLPTHNYGGRSGYHGR